MRFGGITKRRPVFMKFISTARIWLFALVYLTSNLLRAEQTSTPVVPVAVVANVAALSSVAGGPDKIVYVKGYRTDNDGGGGFFHFSSERRQPNLGTVFAASPSGPSGYWVRPVSGEINVKWFGARGDNRSDDTLAIQEALDASNDATTGGYVFFPSGRYHISRTLSNGKSHLGIKGSGRTFLQYFDNTNGTAIIFTGDNAPIVEMGNHRGDFISDITLKYLHLQSPTATNSACIRLADDTIAASMRELNLINGYRGISAPMFAYACVLDNICIESCSGQFIWWQSGELNTATSLYFQNYRSSIFEVPVSKLVRNGRKVTVPVDTSTLEAYYNTNSLIQMYNVKGSPLYGADGFFLTQIAPDSLTFELSSKMIPDLKTELSDLEDKNVNFVATHSNGKAIFKNAYGPMVGPAVYIGAEFAIQALTCEILEMNQNGALLQVGRSANVSIQGLHFEFCLWNSKVRTPRPIVNYGGNLIINEAVMVSSGFAPGQSAFFATQGAPGYTRIDGIKLGGIAHKGASFILAESARDGVVSVGFVNGLGTWKANSDGSYDSPGSAVRPLYQSSTGIIRGSEAGASNRANHFGSAVLQGGTVLIKDTLVTEKSLIFVTGNADGGTPGTYRVTSRIPHESFTITSSQGAADTSTVAYQLIEP